MSPQNLFTATASLALFTAGLATSASADLISDTYNSSSSYDVELSNMPDFDQVRSGLPSSSAGRPGGNYCVPTALTNLLGYIGTHGFPAIGLTAADWENEEDYSLVTTNISNMGALCNTGATTGTTHMDSYNGFSYFVNARCPGTFTITENLATNTTGPTLRSISENNANGAISEFCYGLYDRLGTDVWGRNVLQRNGGHAVTFVRGYRNGSNREIGYSDPDDSTDSTTQSTFSETSFDIDPYEFVYANSLFSAGVKGDRTGSRIMRTDGGRYRMIDSVIHARPRACYNWESSESGWRIIFWDGFADWTMSDAFLAGPSTPHLSDFTIGPMNNCIWFLDRNPADNSPNSQVKKIRLSNQEVSSYDLPHSATKLAFARDHSLIVLGARLLSRVHPFSEGSDQAPAPLTIGLADDADQMVMDDTSDSLWLMDSQAGFVTQLPQKLDEPGRAYAMPQSDTHIKRFAATGNPDVPLALIDADGQVMLCKADIETQQLVIVENFMVEIHGDEDQPFSGIQFNDEGHLLVFSDAGMDTYEPTANGWHRGYLQSVIKGRSVMASSRTNFDAEIHGGEAWRSVPDTAPEAGDLDGDGVVAVDDLLLLLADFGSNGGAGDVNQDGTVGIDDLLILLGNWTS